MLAAEMLGAAASMKTNYAYPVEALYHSWLQMFLNMDRNTLWGAAGSMKTNYSYPVEALYHSWLQMFLNMDRNTLWGAAGGMVFEHETSWDASDRFQRVEST